MTTIRNAGRRPARTRRIARVGQALGIAALTGGLATLTACSDAPLSTPATPSAPRLAASTTVGDTTVTSFRVAPTDTRMIVLSGDYKLKLDIPRGAICDPTTSGYGPTLWDAPCAPAAAAIDFVARTWTDASGRPRLVITPDVRFVPGKVVTLYIKDKQASLDATSNIVWCPTGSTTCVDETKADSSLAPTRDGANGWVSRRVKHFSGYNVVFGLDGGWGGSEMMFSRAASRPGAAPVFAKARSGAGLTEVAGRLEPLARPVSVTYRIDPARGGAFALPGTGLEVTVPAGAVRAPVTITATAPAGRALAYEFQPHGLVFARPLRMRQDLKVLDAKKKDLAALEVTYYGEGSLAGALGGLLEGTVDLVGTVIPVQEFLSAVLDVHGNRVEFEVGHFSGYMVSWGRRR